jgi:Asp-tRNA(Asn)/Glu-tRNA(Gln) amidotransferase A subunit family amidase
VTVPAGEGPARMPLGVQLVGVAGTDARTLAAARWVEGVL